MADTETLEAPEGGPMILTEGIHSDVEMEDYINDPCEKPSLSASTIPRLLVSPRLAKTHHPRLDRGKREFSRAANLGSAAHAAALEGEGVVNVINEKYPDDWKTVERRGKYLLDYKTKLAKDLRQEICDAGKIPLLMHEAPVVEEIRETILRGIHIVGESFGASADEVEQTIIWQEKGVWCRARADLLFMLDSPPGAPVRPCGICDIKTSKSADPDFWERRVMWPSDHDIRAAWYIRGVAAATGSEVSHTYLVAETEPPYDWSRVTVPGEALHLANQLIDIAVEIWRRCLETGKWRGYPKRLHRAEMPKYRAEAFEHLIDEYRHDHPEAADDVFGGKE